MFEHEESDLDFIDMQSIKLSLTCQICRKIYAKPVLLPCNSTMCKIHLTDMPADIIIKKDNQSYPTSNTNSNDSLNILSQSSSPHLAFTSSSASNSYESSSVISLNNKKFNIDLNLSNSLGKHPRQQHQKINYFLRCFFCKKLHELPESTIDNTFEFSKDSFCLFPENQLANNMITNNVYMNAQEKKLKNDFKKLVLQFNEKLNNLTRKHIEHFSDIREQINLQKTKLKLRIDEIANNMIEKVNKYENMFKNNSDSYLNNTSASNKFKDIKAFIEEEFRNLKIDTEKIQKLIDQYKNDLINDNLNNDNSIANNFPLNFKPNFNFMPDLFGELLENSNLNKFKQESTNFQMNLMRTTTNTNLNLKPNVVDSSANDIDIDMTKNLISCSFDTSMELKIWNLNTGQCIRSINKKEKVVCISILWPNKWLASGYGKTIKIWNLADGATLLKLDNKSYVYCLLLLLNGRLASGSLDTTIRIWDLEAENANDLRTKTDCCIDTLTGHTKYVICLENLSNGNLVSTSFDKTIKIWELNSGISTQTIELMADMEWVRCIKSLNNNSKLIACGHNDKLISIWHIETCQCLKILDGHTNAVWDLKLSQIGHLISCSLDKTIKLWNINSGDCIRTLNDHTDSVLCLKLYSNDKLISGSNDKTIKIWDLNKGVCIKTLIGHENNIWSLQ